MGYAQNYSMKGNTDQFFMEGMVVLKPNHSEVIRLQEAGLMPNEFGSRIWRASYLLIHYLSGLSLSKDLHIMELGCGCGWGLPATFIQKRFGAKVTATDADKQVAYYQQLISRINGVNVPFVGREFRELDSKSLSEFDLLIGADICYSQTNAGLLAKLFRDYLGATCGEIILADSGRAPFFQLVAELKLSFEISLKEIAIDLPTRTTGYILRIKNH